MTLNLTANQCSRLSMACLTLAHELEREAHNPDTSADRKEIAARSARMWYALRDELRAQIAEQQGGTE